jgi:hypothetical protein
VLFSFIIGLKIPFIDVRELESAWENENSVYGFISNQCIAAFNCCFVKRECGRNTDYKYGRRHRYFFFMLAVQAYQRDYS